VTEITPTVDLTHLPAVRTILVPLDGSELAETVIQIAIDLRARLGAQVTLIHVLEHDAPATIHGDRHLTTEAEAATYLASVAARFPGEGSAVETHVHPNPEHDVARSIAEHAAEFAADLILIATHGRGGIKGMISGSIAQQIIRQQHVPVLLVPVGAAGTAATIESLGVLVNGTPEAESVVPMAASLALGLRAPMHLILAVPTVETLPGDRAAAGRLVPSTMRAILELEQAQQATYLAMLEERLAANGAQVRSSIVRGDPASAAMSEAERLDVGLLAFATHGRPGAGTIWTGSVGSKIVGRYPRPLLLVSAE
jgi:nucleotide-binding universal stress UspA family protein